MKKVFSTIAALGLVAGMVTSAAALELKIKGDYTVDGFYIDNGNGAAASPGTISGGQGVALTGSNAKSDAWLQHMFNIEAEMVVNDKISMMSRIRLIDWGTVWGSQDDMQVANGQNMSVERLWMVYKSPVGIWDLGRRPGNSFGLSFANTERNFDRIMWRSGKLFGDTFSAYAFYQKTTETDAYLANVDDRDNDYYEAAASLNGGWGKATLAYGYQQNDIDNRPATLAITNFSVDPATGNIASTVTPAFAGSETILHTVKGVGYFKIGDNMGLDTEFDYKFGEKDFKIKPGTRRDLDISRLAFLADFWTQMDALMGHAMYFHTSGDDNGAADGDLDGYGGTGADFEPLYILTGVFGNILNNDQGTTSPSAFDAQNAGVHAFVVHADFAATQDLTLHAGFGYAMADKEKAHWDDEYGFEYNVGAAYKLQDNLIYAVHLGYLDTGDFFKQGPANKDLNNIVLASHHLTMSF